MHAAFDPSASCVAGIQQQKKKPAQPQIEVFILRTKFLKGQIEVV